MTNESQASQFHSTQIVIGTIGVALTFGTLTTSYLQYESNALQAAVADAQLKPTIVVTTERLNRSEEDQHVRFFFRSIAGPTLDVRFESISRLPFFEVYNNNRNTCLYPRARQPAISTDTREILGVFDTGDETWKSFGELRDYVLTESKGTIQSPGPETLVRIDYKDALDRKHYDLFFIYGSESFRIPRGHAERIWRSWSSAPKWEVFYKIPMSGPQPHKIEMYKNLMSTLKSNKSLCDAVQ